ncbi:hypothetical protein D3C85_1371830 [compost metagenome]
MVAPHDLSLTTFDNLHRIIRVGQHLPRQHACIDITVPNSRCRLLGVWSTGKEQEHPATQCLAEGLRLPVVQHVAGSTRHIVTHRLVVALA